MIKFYNTLSNKIELFRPIKEGVVHLYTCGPTVYDFAHIGNFRSYMFEDLLKRFLMFMGFSVKHVMNITDVDDKTIKGAFREGIELKEYTKKYINSFFEDIDTLNINRADYYPLATEHIPDMVKIIKGLLQKGIAYRKNGSIYFNISKFPNYGRLSNIDLKELKPGISIESDEYEKESISDFALWKNRKGNEPYWDTEIGPGRPGWHIECSTMSTKYLGETFDIHCGGVDNIFPHHENEIAQSESYFGKKFVNYWLHCHHLIVEGEKMSKSKGNYYTLRDLIDKGVNPLDLRFLMLSTHYRKMLNFSFEALEQSKISLKRIKDFIYELENRSFKDGENPKVKKIVNGFLQSFKNGLSNDLNISVALASLFEMIKKVNILLLNDQIFDKDAKKIKETIYHIDNVLGVLPAQKDQLIPEEIQKMIDERDKARVNKDYNRADKIRQDLLDKGIVLEDTKDGVRWKKIE
ncbi:MAG: cysteine--tRNA ligase [Elusimicrobiota bacterium]